MKIIRTIPGVLIHAALVVAMGLAGYLSLLILACYIPALQWLYGYDPDPLGVFFTLTLLFWPIIGGLGLIGIIVTRLFKIPLLTAVPAFAYAAVMGFLIWAGDSSSYGTLPRFLRKIPDSIIWRMNAVLLVLAFLCVLIGIGRFIQIVNRQNSQPAGGAYGSPAAGEPSAHP